MRIESTLLFLAAMVLLSMGVDAPATVAEADEAIRVFDANAPVQSRKRGVCANKLHPEDFIALAPGVSWYYNWHFKGDQPPKGVKFEFVPMVWGDTPERLQGLRDYLAEGHRPRAILVNNEPNLKGQAFISPEQSADLHRRVHEITANLDIPLVGPHMAIGSAVPASITAYDPIQQKDVTYTFMIPFLKAFMHYVGETRVDGIGVHPYNNIGEAVWSANIVHRETGKPVWMTEFAWWHAPDERSSIQYLVKASDYFERSEHVHGYAWFKERIGRPHLRLLTDQAGELTPLGKAYVNLPVHDADIYYRMPGRLSAARYVTLEHAEIDLAPDPDDFVTMFATKANALLRYHIYVEQKGRYGLRVSTGGPGGTLILSDASGERARMELPGSPATQPTDPAGAVNVLSDVVWIELPAGTNQWTVQLETSGQWINWIELIPDTRDDAAR
jgi:hypothetical protein